MKKKEEAVETKFNPNEGLSVKHIGMDVHYHKTVLTGSGNKTETFAAKIVGLPDMAAGNLQKKDCAADLQIYKTSKKGGIEERYSVLFSPSAEPNRWTLIE